MSIFPKRVTYGDNVIIHFKIESTVKPRIIDYTIDMYNPKGEGKRIAQKSGLYADTVESYYYYTVVGDDYSIPGRYFLKTKLYVNGRKVNSSSSEMDYFWIDKIKAKKTGSKEECRLQLKNLSDSMTPFQIINQSGDIVMDDVIEAYENRIISQENGEYYIRYGNHYLERIWNSGDVIFYRNNTIRWRPTKIGIDFLDEKNGKIISIDNQEARVWMIIGEGNSWNNIRNSLPQFTNLDVIIKKMLSAEIILKHRYFDINERYIFD